MSLGQRDSANMRPDSRATKELYGGIITMTGIIKHVFGMHLLPPRITAPLLRYRGRCQGIVSSLISHHMPASMLTTRNAVKMAAPARSPFVTGVSSPNANT